MTNETEALNDLISKQIKTHYYNLILQMNLYMKKYDSERTSRSGAVRALGLNLFRGSNYRDNVALRLFAPSFMTSPKKLMVRVSKKRLTKSDSLTCSCLLTPRILKVYEIFQKLTSKSELSCLAYGSSDLNLVLKTQFNIND